MIEVYRNAKSIISTLSEAGFIAYFAGGWVRDFVMGHPSDDIDIATSASPAQIMKLFPQTIPVGIAFGIVIVVMGGHQFEVATFRKDLHYIDGRHPEGIELSNPFEDAKRRDFTINGMFYDPLTQEIYDFVQGQNDIKLGVIRTIGDPHERFFEDRLRMLRAFRFAARFSFAIDPETQDAIVENRDKLFPAVAWERVWQEFSKMVAYPRFDQAIVEMHRLGLLDVIFPELIGMHIKELRHIADCYAHYPKGCPTILYLMALFPSFDLATKIELSRRMTASNKDIKLLEYEDAFRRAITREDQTSAWEWAHLLAHPDYSIVLEVIGAHRLDQESFLERFNERHGALKPHIDRIKEQRPLINSKILMEHGILPGVKMGLLLKEAEKMALAENLHDPKIILHKLSLLPLWNPS